MTLNANKVSFANPSKKYEPLEAGTYPARLAQVIDLGMQPDNGSFGEKPPKNRILTTYEFCDEFLKDEDGQDMPDKPRWLSEQFWLFSRKAEKAISTARLNALDPQDIHGGDFAPLLGTPVNVTVVQDPSRKTPGVVYNNIAAVSPMRQKDADKCPPLVSPPKFFTLDDPDIEVFMSLPTYVQDIIKKNLEFGGSKLEQMLSGVKNPTKAPPKEVKTKPAVEVTGENPYD